jgi:molybdopterin adenylyltransferase
MKFQAAVLTISDGCFHQRKQDLSGPALRDALTAIGIDVIATDLVPDEEDAIISSLQKFILEPSIHLVMTTGGTGFGPRDVTPEATRQLLDRPAPGLAEFLRQSGAAQTPLTWLSRGEAGVAGSTLIINLPGSTKAMTYSVEAIKGLLFHALALINGQKPH